MDFISILRGLFGLTIITALAFLFSNNKKRDQLEARWHRHRAAICFRVHRAAKPISGAKSFTIAANSLCGFLRSRVMVRSLFLVHLQKVPAHLEVSV